ncbi:MAG: PQQ-binding-like beta-propeller repeat protein [Bryobacteraceae bacterium]
MTKLVLLATLISAYPVMAQAPATPARPNGNRLFDQSCTTCHGNANVERAPAPAVLRGMTPEKIYEALTTGAMQVQAKDLADDAKRAIAEYLGDRKLGAALVAGSKLMPNQCAANPALADISSKPAWNGWSMDLANTRFQSQKDAGLNANQVAKLKLKWAFGLPGATSVYSEPSAVGGRVFVAADTGFVYSLNAADGCVYWSFQAQSGVRTAITVAPLRNRPNTSAAYFGDLKGNVYAVDARTGAQLWKVAADTHPLARITAAPKLNGNRLYVPVSSMEENAGSSLNYSCCTFRGSVVALDADTGQQIWKSYTIVDQPKPTRKNSKGTQLWGPAGAGVWSTPTIDVKRNAIYIATGDSYATPYANTTDAIIALDLNTGKVRWTMQATPNDAWIVGCGPNNRSENCPETVGPDYDFGGSPILQSLPNGRSILVAGQKSGIIWALDPDRNGAVLWKTQIAKNPTSELPNAIRTPTDGEFVWGGAADNRNVFFGMNSGGLVAVQLTTGERTWFTPLEPSAAGKRRGHGGAVAAASGVVFSGGWDGTLRALSSEDGSLLWEYDTVKDFQTVNGVTAKGGSMGAPGPTVAEGMLFAGSGYLGFGGGLPGNVLLAFSVE